MVEVAVVDVVAVVDDDEPEGGGDGCRALISLLPSPGLGDVQQKSEPLADSGAKQRLAKRERRRRSKKEAPSEEDAKEEASTDIRQIFGLSPKKQI